MKFSRAAAVFVATVATVLLSATAAMAESTTPTNWPTGPSLSTLQVIGIFVGIPVGLFVVIALLVSFGARHNYVPPTPPAGEALEAKDSDAQSIEAH